MLIKTPLIQIAVDQGCSLSEHGLRRGVVTFSKNSYFTLFLLKTIFSIQLRVEGGKKVGEILQAETEEEVKLFFVSIVLFVYLLH